MENASPQVDRRFTLEQEMLFISGEFLKSPVPKDKQYLLRSFKKPYQKQFISYMLLFGQPEAYVAHTGNHMTLKSVKRFWARVEELITVHDHAKSNLDFETLEQIEKGKFKISAEKDDE